MIEIKLAFATPEEAADAMLKLAGALTAYEVATAAAPEKFRISDEKLAEMHDVAVVATKPRATRKPKAADEAKPDTSTKGNISADPENRQDPENPDEGDGEANDPPAEETKAAWSKEDIDKAIQERIRPALSSYMKVFGQGEARAFLAKFQGRTPETARLSEIEPERFAEFEQTVEAAIAAKGGE